MASEFPTNQEVFDFYEEQYIKRHGELSFQKKIVFLHGHSQADMFHALLEDHLNYVEFIK